VTLFRKELQNTINMLSYPGSSGSIPRLESFGEFLENEIMPTAKKIDAERIFPRDNLDKLFQWGFTRMPFPSQHGGLALPYPIYIAAMEMLAMTCASTSLSISIHGTTCSGIERFGSKEQKTNYLEPMISGKKLAAFALTEPQSGSDAANIQTMAKLEDRNYVLNGTKTFVSNGGQADVYLVFARTDKGNSAFLVDKYSTGMLIGENMGKLGIRGTSWTKIFFENCVVPRENLLGQEGQGFEYAKQMLHGGRITIAALSVGIAQIAFEKALSYCKSRVAFGKPISTFEMITEKLADMSTMINAARQLTYAAAWLKANDKDFELPAAQAKLTASETALSVTDEALQIHGAYGYADEGDIHRHWRDARMLKIGEGTSEIMKLVISHYLLKQDTAIAQ
jgi:butyryl-CoA dehydrogenase